MECMQTLESNAYRQGHLEYVSGAQILGLAGGAMDVQAKIWTSWTEQTVYKLPGWASIRD